MKEHTKTGQQDPTPAQHAGIENRGNPFVAGRGTQNQQNPASQQSKFNTLSGNEEPDEEDRTFDTKSKRDNDDGTDGTEEIKEADVEDIDKDVEDNC